MRRCWFLLLLLLALPAHATIQCDGVDDRLTFTGVAVGTTHTITAWFLPTPTGVDWGTILDSAASTDGLWYRSASCPHCLNYTHGGGAGNMQSSTGSVPEDGTWQHVAVVVTAGSGVMFINGVQAATGTGYAARTFANICNDTSGDKYTGKLGEVTVYDVALSPSELATLVGRRQHFPRLSRQPIAYWPLDQCADGANAGGTAFVDRSGNGNTATASAGANTTGLTCSGEFVYPWGAN